MSTNKVNCIKGWCSNFIISSYHHIQIYRYLMKKLYKIPFSTFLPTNQFHNFTAENCIISWKKIFIMFEDFHPWVNKIIISTIYFYFQNLCGCLVFYLFFMYFNFILKRLFLALQKKLQITKINFQIFKNLQ